MKCNYLQEDWNQCIVKSKLCVVGKEVCQINLESYDRPGKTERTIQKKQKSKKGGMESKRSLSKMR